MPKWVAFSVDLEPNKDDTLAGIEEAMTWYDEKIPQGTVYATYRIATELPNVIAELAGNHEIGVHVHPREFGHNHDQLAELPPERQRELITKTRSELAVAADINESEIIAFRAGRHSTNQRTLHVLSDLGFAVDASINVNYTDYLPESLTRRQNPFVLESGLVEMPTTYGCPPLFSRAGLHAFPSRTVTATANTLRTDKRGTTGLVVLQWLLKRELPFSFYMHPYDATRYHKNLENNGSVFRNRVASLLNDFNGEFLTAREISRRQ